MLLKHPIPRATAGSRFGEGSVAAVSCSGATTTKTMRRAREIVALGTGNWYSDEGRGQMFIEFVECHALKRLGNKMKIFVANLSGETTEDDLRQAFESFGQVRSATIVMHPAASKSRRFGFVIMSSASQAQKAIQDMNGKNLRGQRIKVEKSRTNAKARSIRRKRSRSGAGSRADGNRRDHSGSRRRRRH